MKCWFTILFCLLGATISAQELPAIAQQQLENLADENEEDDALLQELDFYRRHPVNLNTATAEDMQPLRFLTDLQIAAFVRYRHLFGKLIDIYELQAVPGFDLITINRLRPYVFAGPVLSAKEAFLSRFTGGDRYALFRISRVLEKSRGYDTSLATHYLGDRNHLFLRYRYQYKTLLQYGLVADKDAGEQFLAGNGKSGFDFYSVHFFVRQLGKLKALAIGDYTVDLGQGLVQWQSLGFGKSADIMNCKRQSPVLLPYRSAGEFYFNRGAGATIRLRSWEATGFISYKKFSGNLADSSTSFTSFGTSGYYRTRLEVADRYKLSDLSAGGNLSYGKDHFKIGLNAVVHRFSSPLQKQNEPYNYFAPSGTEAFNASIDYSYTYKNIHLFGEAAVDKKGTKAFVQGALVSADPKVDLSILYRNLPAAYQSVFGNAFTENSSPSNEKGLYAGAVIRPSARWQLAAYADYFAFPFLKYRVNAGTRGWDYLAQLTYTPDKKSEVYLRYRTANKPVNGTAAPFVVNYPVTKIKQGLRFQYSTELSSGVAIQTRTELVWFDKRGKEAEEGFLSFIEAGYRWPFRLTGNMRLQYFETGGYNSRIYAYESDVLYAFSIPAFYDKGFRYYVNAGYGVSGKFTLWLRMAQTLCNDKQTTGAGLDEIAGGRRTEVKIQVRYDF